MYKQFIFIIMLLAANVTHAQYHIPFNSNTIIKQQKKIIVGKHAVVCAHPVASMVGNHVLNSGGNAFDAAIAVQFTLAVVYPQAGNIGGGGFLVAYTKDRKTISLDYREKAPGNAQRNMFIDEEGNALLEKSQNGQLASGIPGTVAGIFEIMPYAKLPLDSLILPAISIAKNGFAITTMEANNLNGLQDDLKKYNSYITAFQKTTNWKEGDTLKQPDLANTLEQIRVHGKAGFYEGVVADYIVAEMNKGGGIISLNDLKTYKATWRKPLQFNYKGHTIISMAPPSSGGIILQQLLGMSTILKLHTHTFQSVQAVHKMVEAERLAYADRAEFLGDPDFVDIPLKTLGSKVYLQKRLQNFSPNKAGKSLLTKAGTIKKSEETTHISIIDKEGNAVAITTTLNDAYGSNTVVEHAGFFLNNEMDDFSIKPGVPNIYGAIGGEANSIAPYKTMLSSMTPTIVLKNNKPIYVVGTPGGTTIPTSVYQVLVNLIDFKLSPEDAVWKPRFHHQWKPDEIFVEKKIENSLADSLSKLGHNITRRGNIGKVELIYIKPNKQIIAIADIRGDDDARGN
jgi:gamma-glutamyltranspeptidase / glutathione hydrolase